MKKYAIIMAAVAWNYQSGLKNILKNPGEKSLKAPFAIYLDLECLLKKNNIVKIFLKNLTQRKKLSMSLLVGQCLQHVHLIKKETKLNYYRGKVKRVCN